VTLAISALSCDAPICAAELTVRWYSAQLAETTAEHTIAVEGKLRDLPGGAFSLAEAECPSSSASLELAYSPAVCGTQDASIARNDVITAMIHVLADSTPRTSSCPSYGARMASTSCLPQCEPVSFRRAISFPLCV